MHEVKRVTILGATGTIGKQTLDVIALHPDKFSVFALTANASTDVLFEQCRQYLPRYAVLLDESAAESLRQQLLAAGSQTQVLWGIAALEFVSAHPEVDVVMAAIVGAAGLKPAIAAAHAGKRILLTASGGPFRNTSATDLEKVTPKQALNHPNWVMGPKITIDSATLMNKGLEVIEAHWLFSAGPEQIQVVVHPQSVIHSMVEYIDGSVLAQLGNPDMRTPIAFALGYPERLESGVPSLDFFTIGKFDFEAPDMVKFPCLRLAFDSLRTGGTAPAILNAANEVAVAAFLNERIGFTDIPRMIESALEQSDIQPASSLDSVIEADRQARLLANAWMDKH